jgi:hypothetical protein
LVTIHDMRGAAKAPAAVADDNEALRGGGPSSLLEASPPPRARFFAFFAFFFAFFAAFFSFFAAFLTVRFQSIESASPPVDAVAARRGAPDAPLFGLENLIPLSSIPTLLAI